MKKVALITGITGQDGSYLTEFLIERDYIVHGVIRRSSQFNTQRIDHLYQDPHRADRNLVLHYGDLTDSSNLIRIIQEIQPTEIYNLGAMSHVKVSFDSPEYTANADALGTLRILEALRILGMSNTVKFYQASTSELFGIAAEIPQNENTRFYPRSPYGVAKLYAYWIVVNYREAYNMFACNGILFNHESPRRGGTFVTKKITAAVARITSDLQECLYLGNLDAKRDWGHAKDYVRAMWLMLQQEEPEDFIIATGKTTSIREFALKAFSAGGLTIRFEGQGEGETGIVESTEHPSLNHLQGKTVLRIDPAYYRPTEVDLLIGDASKAAKHLGWIPQIGIDALIDEMVQYDLNNMNGSHNSALNG